MKEFTVTRKWRGCTYKINVIPGETGKGISSLKVNGEMIDGNLIPVMQRDEVIMVEVRMK